MTDTDTVAAAIMSAGEDIAGAVARLAAAVEKLLEVTAETPEPPEATPCPRCAGKGEFGPGAYCTACDGSGTVSPPAG